MLITPVGVSETRVRMVGDKELNISSHRAVDQNGKPLPRVRWERDVARDVIAVNPLTLVNSPQVFEKVMVSVFRRGAEGYKLVPSVTSFMSSTYRCKDLRVERVARMSL